MKTHLIGDILAVRPSRCYFEILEGKFLAIAGESAKSAKIFPLQNFALYGMRYLNKTSCMQQIITTKILNHDVQYDGNL